MKTLRKRVFSSNGEGVVSETDLSHTVNSTAFCGREVEVSGLEPQILAGSLSRRRRFSLAGSTATGRHWIPTQLVRWAATVLFSWGVSIVAQQTNQTELTLKGGEWTAPAAQTVLAVAVSGNRACVTGDRLHVIDVSDPAHPLRLGGCDLSGGVGGVAQGFEVAVSGSYAYVATYGAGLQVIDISDPVNPQRVGVWDTNAWTQGVAVSGNYAYVACITNVGLHVIDISNPANPQRVGGCTTGYPRDVVVSGHYAYVTDEAGLQVIDVANPADPQRVSGLKTPGWAWGVAVSGHYAYVTDSEEGLQVIDVSNPLDPQRVGGFATSGMAHCVAVSGNFAYVTDSATNLHVIDISNPTNPRRAGGSTAVGYASDMVVSGHCIYVAADSNALRIFEPAYLTGRSVSEAESQVTITVPRTGDVAAAGTLSYHTVDRSAVAGQDCLAKQGELAFEAGQTNGTFSVLLLNDGRPEPTELFEVELSDSPPGSVLSVDSPTVVGISILDNDLGFNAEPASVAANESVGEVVFTVQRQDDWPGVATVDYRTVDASAKAGDDYTAVSGTLTFAAGGPSQQIRVPILNDGIRESEESFTLRLSNPTGGTGLGAQANAVVVIQDNDPSVRFGSSEYSVGEAAGLARVEVLRGSDANETVSVECRAVGGTATTGLDYSPGGWMITFAPGESSKTIDLWIVNDGLAEGDETVELTLTNVVGGPGLGDPATAVVRIVDDEVPIGLGLDLTFDPAGAVDSVRAIALQPNGRVLAGGTFGLVGLFADGSPDPSFHRPSFDAEVWSAVLTGENQVLVGGAFGSVNEVGRPGLVRLNEDGTVDESFVPAAGGRLVKVDAAGRILVYEDCDNGCWLKRLNADGSLDTGFAVESSVLGCPRTVAPLADGRVLMGGDDQLLRLNADGSLDTDFHRPLLADTESGGPSVRVIAVVEGGRILIGGRFTHVDGLPRGGIARLNTDGTVDTSFDTGTGLRIQNEDSPSRPATVSCMLPLPGGGVLVAGDFNTVQGVPRRHLAVIEPEGSLGARYASLTMLGFWWFAPTINALALPADGRILIGGWFWEVNGRSLRNLARLFGPGVTSAFEFTDLRRLVGEGEGVVSVRVRRGGDSTSAVSVRVGFGTGSATLGADYLGGSRVLTFAPLETEQEFALAIVDDAWQEADETIELTLSEPSQDVVIGTHRMVLTIVDNDRAGSLDTTFAGPFRPTSDQQWVGGVYGLLVQPDGRIVVRGDLPSGTDSQGGDITRGFVRLNRDGSLDASFTPPPGVSDILTVLPDGRLIARSGTKLIRLRSDGLQESGFAVPADWRVSQVLVQSDGRLMLVGSRMQRVNWDGTTDTSFQELSFQYGTGSGWAGTVAGTPDGRLVVGGAFRRVNGEARWNVARLKPDGTLDSGFVTPDLGESSVSCLVVQGDGKVVAGGWFSVTNAAAVTASIVRFNEDGTLDASFLRGAGARYEGDGQTSVSAILQQRDGKLVVAGNFSRFHGAVRNGLARLNSDGSLDPTFELGVQPRFVYPNGDVEANGLSALALLPNGQIIVGGRFNEWGGLHPFLVARVNAEFLTRFTSPRLIPDGVFEFGLQVQSGRTYVLEVSSDLRAWVPVSTNTAAAGELWFHDLNARANPQVFYRAVGQ